MYHDRNIGDLKFTTHWHKLDALFENLGNMDVMSSFLWKQKLQTSHKKQKILIGQ